MLQPQHCSALVRCNHETRRCRSRARGLKQRGGKAQGHDLSGPRAQSEALFFPAADFFLHQLSLMLLTVDRMCFFLPLLPPSPPRPPRLSLGYGADRAGWPLTQACGEYEVASETLTRPSLGRLVLNRWAPDLSDARGAHVPSACHLLLGWGELERAESSGPVAFAFSEPRVLEIWARFCSRTHETPSQARCGGYSIIESLRRLRRHGPRWSGRRCNSTSRPGRGR